MPLNDSHNEYCVRRDLRKFELQESRVTVALTASEFCASISFPLSFSSNARNIREA